MFLHVLVFVFCCLNFFQDVGSVQCDSDTCSKRCKQVIGGNNKTGESDKNVVMGASIGSSVGLLIVVVIIFGSVLCIRSRRLQKKLLQNKLTNQRSHPSLLNEYSGPRGQASPIGPPSKQSCEEPNDYEEINYFELDNPKSNSHAKDNKYFSGDESGSSNYYLTPLPYNMGKPSNPPPSAPLPLDVFKQH